MAAAAIQSRVLTHLGYSLLKGSLPAAEQAAIKKELTVAPKVAGPPRRFWAGAPDDSFPVYLESTSRFYVPRMWARARYGAAEGSILSPGAELRPDLRFVGTPYDYQVSIVDTFLAAAEEQGGGLICVPCGRGKTFMAINVAARLGRRFLIVVDKEFLLQQWSGELRALMPGIRIGILQQDKQQMGTEVLAVAAKTQAELKELARGAGLKVGGTKPELLARLAEAGIATAAEPETVTYDCTIAMIQTLVTRNFAEAEFRDYGLTIFDECHHLGAAHFSRSLQKVQTRVMLGLSATPTRDDGLTKVFEWYIGKPVYWEQTREADPDVVVKKVSFTSDDPAYAVVPLDFRGEPVLARLLTQVIECEARNQVIDEVLKEMVSSPERRILVLSDRRSHLERIAGGLPAGTTFGYYVGGMKSEGREEGARTAQVILGTYAMASEAMNIKTLNAMVMASPRKKIEQSTGRILRVQKGDRVVEPLIVDIVDSHSVYQGQWFKRRVYYRKCKYKIVDPQARGKAIAVEEEAEAEPPQGCQIVDD
jgi:superfamily II DNA or RNA helicase